MITLTSVNAPVIVAVMVELKTFYLGKGFKFKTSAGAKTRLTMIDTVTN